MDHDDAECSSTELVGHHWTSVGRENLILGADVALADDLAQGAYVLAITKEVVCHGAPPAPWLLLTFMNSEYAEQLQQGSATAAPCDPLVSSFGVADSIMQRRFLNNSGRYVTIRGLVGIRGCHGHREVSRCADRGGVDCELLLCLWL
jgi:hypothetical protein